MKRNMLRITTAMGLVAAMTVSQSAPVLADDNSGDKITLTFAFDEGVGTPTEEAIEAFNASQDEIQVESYHLPQDANNLAWNDFVNKMVSEDTSIDVMALDVVLHR